MELIERTELSYVKEVDEEMRAHFLAMTPMMFGKEISSEDVAHIRKLTFEFVLLVGKKK